MVFSSPDLKEGHICPLCCESTPVQDRQYAPCECGYQICFWCHQLIKRSVTPNCPWCRRPYKGPFNLVKVSIPQPEKQEDENLPRKSGGNNSDANKSSPSSGEGGCDSGSLDGSLNSSASSSENATNNKASSRKSKVDLREIRVIRKTLCYVVGLSLDGIEDEEELKSYKYFGKYGKILSLVINKNPNFKSSDRKRSCAVYVNFSSESEAKAALSDIDGAEFDGRRLKASFGTTKYCSSFIKGTKCLNKNCLYLHEEGTNENSFTTVELARAKQQSKQLSCSALLANELKDVLESSDQGPTTSTFGIDDRDVASAKKQTVVSGEQSAAVMKESNINNNNNNTSSGGRSFPSWKTPLSNSNSVPDLHEHHQQSSDYLAESSQSFYYSPVVDRTSGANYPMRKAVSSSADLMFGQQTDKASGAAFPGLGQHWSYEDNCGSEFPAGIVLGNRRGIWGRTKSGLSGGEGATAASVAAGDRRNNIYHQHEQYSESHHQSAPCSSSLDGLIPGYGRDAMTGGVIAPSNCGPSVDSMGGSLDSYQSCGGAYYKNYRAVQYSSSVEDIHNRRGRLESAQENGALYDAPPSTASLPLKAGRWKMTDNVIAPSRLMEKYRVTTADRIVRASELSNIVELPDPHPHPVYNDEKKISRGYSAVAAAAMFQAEGSGSTVADGPMAGDEEDSPSLEGEWSENNVVGLSMEHTKARAPVLTI